MTVLCVTYPMCDSLSVNQHNFFCHNISLLSFFPNTGPAQKMPATATALDFFQLFVPDNCIQNMVTQTNMYAKKFQERFGSDEGWRPVTAQEMKAFLGFVTSTSVHRCESVLSIWSSGFFSNQSIALKMSQSRFEKILKYFHIVAFRPSQGSNQGLYKIQPFLDSLQQSFSCTFRPSQTQVCALRQVVFFQASLDIFRCFLSAGNRFFLPLGAPHFNSTAIFYYAS